MVFSLVAKQQGANPWGEGTMGYTDFIGIWDSDWYRSIAQNGYPHELPVHPDGSVRQNNWAFYPLLPLLARALMALGLDFTVAASFVSVVCGALASLVIYQLFRTGRARVTGVEEGGGLLAPGAQADRTALVATALVLLSPVSPVLQTPYGESTNLLFLSALLLALVSRRWWLAALLLLPVCLSRPVGVPLAAALGIWWCARVIARLRRRTPDGPSLPRRATAALRETWPHLLTALFACFTALLWPIIAWLSTGRLDAYTATETAWRGEHLLPVEPWVDQSWLFFGDVGPLVLVLLVLVVVWALGARVVRRELPGSVRIWIWCYLAYLLVFLFPQSSTFRLLLPIFPVAGPLVALSRSRAYRVLLLVGAGLGQLIWVGWLWHWKELPSGGDFPP